MSISSEQESRAYKKDQAEARVDTLFHQGTHYFINKGTA